MNTLHCLIRTQIHGQLRFHDNSRSNCFGAVKLDYLNPHKQAFITHHYMLKREKNQLEFNEKSLRNEESALYGVERLTETERMQMFVQTQLRSNNKLVIGRIQIPSRKLMSVSIIDHNTLLVDEFEHVYLRKRYNDALFTIDRLFQYLLNESKCDVDRQYLLAYDHTSDAINIFAEDVQTKNDKDTKSEQDEKIKQSEDTNGIKDDNTVKNAKDLKKDTVLKMKEDVQKENGVKTETKMEVRTDMKSELDVKSETNIKPENQPEADIQMKGDTETETNTVPELDISMAEPELQDKEDADIESKANVKSETGIKLKEDAKIGNNASSDIDTKMKTDIKMGNDVKSDIDAKIKEAEDQKQEVKSNEGADERRQLFDFHGYVDEFCGKLNDNKIDYIPPYSIRYRGTMKSNHIPDISPPTNSDLPKPCQMFLFHGYCPKYHAQISNDRRNKNKKNRLS